MSTGGHGKVLEETFRRESARVVGMLARMLGDLDRAEDVFQEAIAAAAEHWPTSGLPDNPGAWLSAVARNRALDELRRERLRGRRIELPGAADQSFAGTAADPSDPEGVADDV